MNSFFQRTELPTGEYYISPFAKVMWSLVGVALMAYGGSVLSEVVASTDSFNVREQELQSSLAIIVGGAAILLFAPYYKRSPTTYDHE